MLFLHGVAVLYVMCLVLVCVYDNLGINGIKRNRFTLSDYFVQIRSIRSSREEAKGGRLPLLLGFLC